MRYIYHRCSTEHQEFMQQQKVVHDYLKGIGADISQIVSVVEKVSGSVRHTERKLNDLLKSCRAGDEIYISELSRLGRNMSDLFSIVTEATEKGVTIIQCKDGTRIEMDSIGGKALMFALSLAAEIELANIRQRTKAGLDARKSRGQEIGGTKELWGSRTYGSREEAEDARQRHLEDISSKSAEAHTAKAKRNPNNVELWKAVELWEARYGEIRLGRGKDATDFSVMAEWLNGRGLVTSTGKEFDKNRCRKSVLICKNLYGGCHFAY